jgi:hypothetical protein
MSNDPHSRIPRSEGLDRAYELVGEAKALIKRLRLEVSGAWGCPPEVSCGDCDSLPKAARLRRLARLAEWRLARRMQMVEHETHALAEG